MRVRGLAAFAAVAAVGLAACGSDDSTGAPTVDDLDDRTFTSTEVTGHELVADSTIRLAFQGESLSANAGCNTLNAGYTITDGALETEQFAMTMMACPDELMAQDDWLSDFLTGGPDVELDGPTLTLAGADASVVLAEVADAPLTETMWTVTGTVANQGVSSVPAEPTAWMQFLDDGILELSTGCNLGGGDVEIGDDTLTFEAIGVTERACADDAGNELEAQILAVLQGEVRYEIDGNSLSLRTDGPDGEIGLELTADA